MIWLNLHTVLRSIAGSDAINALPRMVRRYDLGKIDGVPLSFTDGAALPGGGIVFTAVAESAEDSYEDGPCVGAAVGVIGPDGDLDWVRKVRPLRKLEGVAVRPGSRGSQVLLVTDADDASVPAVLYATSLPRGTIMRVKGPSRRAPSPRR